MKYHVFFALVTFTLMINTHLANADSSEISPKPNPQSVDEKIIQSTTTGFSGDIPICANPVAAGVNPKTNLVYVTCWESYWDETKIDSVYVINALDNSISDIIPVGIFPSSIAVNENNNKVYVTNFESNSVTIIDGTTNSVLSTISDINYHPYRVAIDSHANMAYVTAASTLVVIDGSDDNVQSIIQLPRFDPTGIAINPNNNRAYISHEYAGSISVVDTVENKIVDELTIGDKNFGLGLNPNTNLLYVSSIGNISVLDTLTKKILANIPTSTYFSQMSVNPITNKVYTANGHSNSTSVIDGKTNKITDIIKVGFMAESVAVNPDSNLIYVVNRGSDSLSIIDGATNSRVNGSQQETGESSGGGGIVIEIILSPLKQLKSGIEPRDVSCKQGLELVMKKSNGQPICVKTSSVKTLTLRNYISEHNGAFGGEIESRYYSVEESQETIQMVLSDKEIKKLIEGKDYVISQVRDGVWCDSCVCPENGCTLVGFSKVKSQQFGVAMTVILNPITGEIFDINTSELWNQEE